MSVHKSYCSFLSQFQKHLTEKPHDIAVRFLVNGRVDGPVHCWSYMDLNRRAHGVSENIIQRNLCGARVLLQYEHGLEFVAAFIGCLYAKAIPVSVYPLTTAGIVKGLGLIKTIYEDAQAKIILCSRLQYDLVGAETHRDAALDELAPVMDNYLVTENIATEISTKDETSSIDKPLFTDCCADDIAFLQYTSGSTGDPKGVIITHGNLSANISVIKECFGFSENHNMVCWLPFNHDMGLIGNVLYPISHGIPVTFMSPSHFIASPLKWLKAISHYKATLVAAPDFAYRLVIAVCSKRRIPKDLDLSSLDVAINGAEPISAETFVDFQAVLAPYGLKDDVFYPSFGMAEATLVLTTKTRGTLPKTRGFDRRALARGAAKPLISIDPTHPNVKNIVSCGVAVPGHKIAIIDPKTYLLKPSGRIGELCINGPSITQGYWNKPKVNANLFVALGTEKLPFLRTGDLGFISDGELFITGRIKDLIIVRGKNYAPQDIETSVAEVYGLRSGCVIAFSVDSTQSGVSLGGEKLVLVAERIKRGPEDEALMSEVCHVISTCHGLEVSLMLLLESKTIPKTTSGKLSRSVCRHEFMSGKLNTIARRSSNIDPLRSDRYGDLEPSGREFYSGIGEVDSATDHSGEAGSVCASETTDIISDDHIVSRALLMLLNKLRNIIADHLNLAASAILEDKPFNELGLDSFQLIRLTQRISDEMSVELDSLVFYNHKTPKALAGYLLEYLAREPKTNYQVPSGNPSAGDNCTSDLLYRNLHQVMAKAEEKSVSYRFDLENDVAWGRMGEPGDYYPEALLDAAGIDTAVLASEPKAREMFQWACAVTICSTFDILETGLIEFSNREGDRLGNTKSIRQFCEEENKHVQLFRRLGRRLREQCPQDGLESIGKLDEYCRETYLFLKGLFVHPVSTDEQGSSSLLGEHFTLWLDALFFESFSIYLQIELSKVKESIQPAWLSAHLCHAREEVHHVVTGANYLSAINLSDSTRIQLSEAFMEKYNQGFLDIFCLSAPIKLIKDLWPQLNIYPRTVSLIDAPVFDDLLNVKIFRDLRKNIDFEKFRTKQKEQRAFIQDVMLADDIALQPGSFESIRVKTVFLTGATGFLGAFLLRDFLKKTDVTVLCLVRANNPSAAKLRVVDNLKRYQLWNDSMLDRIRVVVGNLGLPLLGLDDAGFDALSRSIDSICHNGAALDFNKSYDELKAINVRGTLAILKLATLTKNIPVHHVSTVSVFDSSTHYGREIQETDTPDHQGISLGYSQSKWVAEQLVFNVGKKGLITSVIRVGTLTGDSHNGCWNTDDIICRLLKGSALVGCYPNLEIKIDMTPVDYVSRALVTLALNRPGEGDGSNGAKIYHLNTPSPISWRKVMSWMNFYGYNMTQVSYDVWLDNIKKQPIDSLNPLQPLIPFLSTVQKNGRTALEILEMKPTFLNSETIRVLEGAEGNDFIPCPKISADLLDKYFLNFHDVGFLLRPEEGCLV